MKTALRVTRPGTIDARDPARISFNNWAFNRIEPTPLPEAVRNEAMIAALMFLMNRILRDTGSNLQVDLVPSIMVEPDPKLERESENEMYLLVNRLSGNS